MIVNYKTYVGVGSYTVQYTINVPRILRTGMPSLTRWYSNTCESAASFINTILALPLTQLRRQSGLWAVSS